MENISKEYQHQHDLNGCGIACLANLLNKEYLEIKSDFENNFYKVDKGIKVSDLVKYLNSKGLNYAVKFCNTKRDVTPESVSLASKLNSITLIRKSKKYPIGHYLLKVETGWVDPWMNLPSIHNVYAGIRKELPEKPWYIIYSLQD